MSKNKKVYDYAIAYTDGSHITNPDGTGLGIHVYAFNQDVADALSSGGKFPHIPEALTTSGYKPFAEVGGEDKCVELKTKDIGFYECIHPLPISSAQQAELTAFLIVANETPFVAKNMIVYTDSKYLQMGLTQWLPNWKKNKWCRRDGSVISNLKIWRRLDETYQRVKDSVKVVKIAAHVGHYGNEEADRLAKKGSALSAEISNGADCMYEANWNKFESDDYIDAAFNDETLLDLIDPVLKAKKSKMPARVLPPIICSRMSYLFTNEDMPTMKLNGKDVRYMLSGDHMKNKEDLALLGKFIPDTLFSVTTHLEPVALLKRIADDHYKRAWKGVPPMKTYQTIVKINNGFLGRKKFIAAMSEGTGVYDLTVKDDSPNALYYGDTLISHISKPPLLAYRAIEIRDELAIHLKNIVEGHDNYLVHDITDQLFDEKDKPTKEFYRRVDRSFKVKIKQPCSDKEVPVVMSRTIDIPDRTDINRIHNPGGKWQIVSWKQDTRVFRYALVYLHENENAIWVGYYSNMRVLTDKEV